MICLETKHFAAALEIEFKNGFGPQYDEYRFELFNVMQNSWPGQLSCVMSTDGGATYDTRPVYKIAGYSKWTEGVVELANSAAHAWANVGIDMEDSLPYGMCGSMRLKSSGTVAGSAVHSSYIAETTRVDAGTLNIATAVYQGFYIGAPGARVNAVKFFGSGTPCTFSGLIKLYGIGG